MEYNKLYNKALESKEELLEYVEHYVDNTEDFIGKTIDTNRLILTFDDYILKVAFNQTGTLENFKEILTYNEIIENGKGKITSFIDKRLILKGGEFEEYSDSTSATSNDFYILLIDSKHVNSNFELEEILNDSYLYLFLKKVVVSIETNAFIGKISPDDFYFSDGKVVFKNLENIFPIYPLKYPDLLRFDLEDFLSNYNAHRNSLYRVPNSKKILTYDECYKQFLKTGLYEKNKSYESLFFSLGQEDNSEDYSTDFTSNYYDDSEF